MAQEHEHPEIASRRKKVRELRVRSSYLQGLLDDEEWSKSMRNFDERIAAIENERRHLVERRKTAAQRSSEAQTRIEELEREIAVLVEHAGDERVYMAFHLRRRQQELAEAVGQPDGRPDGEKPASV